MNAFLECVQRSIAELNVDDIDAIAQHLLSLRQRQGRLFIIGNGGGHSHASHAAADFRTLCKIDAHALDNAANLTALANDEGFHNCYQRWLSASHFTDNDLLLVISVGGGDDERHVSENIVNAVVLATQRCTVGICGRDGGYTAQHSPACVIIPCNRPELVTCVVEGVQSVILHALVSHLAVKPAKWESVDAQGDIP